MKLAQFKTENSEKRRLGVLLDDIVCDVAELARALKSSGREPASWLLEVTSTLDLINRGPAAIDELKTLLSNVQASHGRGAMTAFSLDAIEFLPAVNGRKILAIGRNYVDHAIEGGAAPPKAPLIFNKLPNALSAHEKPIVLPTISSKVDYEAELAVVIGR